jgi:hypothetical protein
MCKQFISAQVYSITLKVMTSITQKISFGVMASLAALATLMSPFTSFASASTWQATAPAPLVFSCLGNGSIFNHTVNTVAQSSTGTLAGTGTYDSDTSYTWNLTGTVTGSTVAMVITYTGTAAGSVYNLNGAIASDGSVSGTADSYCQSFTMPAGSFALVKNDHDNDDRDNHKKHEREDSHHHNHGKHVHNDGGGKIRR